MGRELKRVPLDWDWPLDKIWKGYINPYSKYCGNCPDCDGSGESPESKRLSDLWYAGQHGVDFKPEDNGSVPFTSDSPAVRRLAIKNILMSAFSGPGIKGYEDGCKAYWGMYKEGIVDSFVEAHLELEPAIHREGRRLSELFNGSWCYHLNDLDVKALLDDGRLTDFTRYPRNEEQKAEFDAIEKWNEEERQRAIAADWKGERNWKTFNNGYVPTAQEVNDWNISCMGHDAINSWVCVKARLKREGVKTSKCRTCKGHGSYWADRKRKRLHGYWRSYEPPKGKGYQLWTTTNEGAPISPVFPSLEELCEWCADNASTFADCKATKEAWMNMLDANFVCHKEGNNIFM